MSVSNPTRRGVRFGTLVVAVVVATAFVTIYRPPQQPLLQPPFQQQGGVDSLASARFEADAYGLSGGVKMRFVLPGSSLDVQLAGGDTSRTLAYQWVRVVDTVPTGSVRPLAGERLFAPEMPGFYRLALLHQGQRRLVDGLTLTVLIPFGEKEGAVLQGVKLGTWAAERGDAERKKQLPDGFFAVGRTALDLPVSDHLQLGDLLVTPDSPASGASGFATLDPRLIDKLELVMVEVKRHLTSDAGSGRVPRLTINSGFRPPVYNRTVSGAASDSRHQYGDAADIRIDLNGDGRFSLAEARVVARAVEAVERAHPRLAGGLGLYTSRRYRSPYIHVDARGKRVRWTG